jgi:hypothetical protein
MVSKVIILPALAVMALLLTAGCLKELVDPKMDIKVVEVKALGSPPALVNDTLAVGEEYLYIRINLTSENEKVDQWVNPAEFTVDNNGSTTYQGLFMANMEMRSIGRILVDAGTSKVFWVVFKVPSDQKMTHLRFEATADEPIEETLPDYAHSTG